MTYNDDFTKHNVRSHWNNCVKWLSNKNIEITSALKWTRDLFNLSHCGRKKFHSQCEQTINAFHIGATHQPNQKHTRKRNNRLVSHDAGIFIMKAYNTYNIFVRNLYIFNLSSSSSYFYLKKFSKIVPHRSKMCHWKSDIKIPCWSTQYMYTLCDISRHSVI